MLVKEKVYCEYEEKFSQRHLEGSMLSTSSRLNQARREEGTREEEKKEGV